MQTVTSGTIGPDLPFGHDRGPVTVAISTADLVAPVWYETCDEKIVWLGSAQSEQDFLAASPGRPHTLAEIGQCLEQRAGQDGPTGLRAQSCRVHFEDGSDRPGCIAVADPNALKLAEQQTFLLNETIHRARNALMIVSAIASQTLGQAVAPAQLAAFQERLRSLHDALAAACDVTDGECEVVEIVARVVARFCPQHDKRIRCAGPNAKISARRSTSLALALHELGTNAAKYGALSVPDGFVTIEWAFRNERSSAILALVWRERGGPPVEVPAREGSGLQLIRRVLGSNTGCRVELTFGRQGLSCQFDLPLS